MRGFHDWNFSYIIGKYHAWFQLISHVFQMLTIINRDIIFSYSLIVPIRTIKTLKLSKISENNESNYRIWTFLSRDVSHVSLPFPLLSNNVNSSPGPSSWWRKMLIKNFENGCLPFTTKFRKFRLECKW